MININEKLNKLKMEFNSRKIKIMIIGLGSVGNYLLDYLMSLKDENIEIAVVGRNKEKMTSDVNIIRVSSMIRNQNRTTIKIFSDVNLEDVDSIKDVILDNEPDIIVNSSRAYSGLKYGSISWKNIRAYGIWTPLAIRYTKNIMEAYKLAGSKAIVINTSYSDAVIPWLKSADKLYPDFGSGNINHLIPRIKFAVAKEKGIKDYWNIDVTFAVAHFHDVVISKEGQTENVDMLIDIRYKSEKIDIPFNDIAAKCSILMPTDAKRNQMNASSNFEIINSILLAVRKGDKVKFHSPGVFGEIGGYPVIIDGTAGDINAYICEDYFSLDKMRQKNRESIYLDGIENIESGSLFYTDELLEKIKNKFNVSMPKRIYYDEIDEIATYIIEKIIKPNV